VSDEGSDAGSDQANDTDSSSGESGGGFLKRIAALVGEDGNGNLKL
jgi:hypothetical protein